MLPNHGLGANKEEMLWILIAVAEGQIPDRLIRGDVF